MDKQAPHAFDVRSLLQSGFTEKITHHVDHRAPCCPDCGGKLRIRTDTRKRYTEDIPKDLTPEVTEHTIHRDYCPHCKKTVEPTVPDAMPGATIGHRTVVLTAFLHYFVGTTISRIVEIFNTQFSLRLTPGGLVHLWQTLAAVLLFWYEQILEQARNSAMLHADETGWRVNGTTYWLWCFTNRYITYGLGIENRLSRLIEEEWENVEAKRLVKRLKRHRKELLVFLYHDGVPFDNNHAERTIRNGVVMRKNSYCNRSMDGAKTQAVLMSIFATLKQRGHHGTKVIVDALREYLTTKKMPTLPEICHQSAE